MATGVQAHFGGERVNLPPKPSIAAAARTQRAGERELIGPEMGQHRGEESETVNGHPVLPVPGYESGPRHGVSVRHFVEHLVRAVQVTEFTVHVNDVVGDEYVAGDNRVVGDHVAVEMKTVSDQTPARALVEQSRVGFTALGSLGGIED